jgi:hypothetical protein
VKAKFIPSSSSSIHKRYSPTHSFALGAATAAVSLIALSLYTDCRRDTLKRGFLGFLESLRTVLCLLIFVEKGE